MVPSRPLVKLRPISGPTAFMAELATLAAAEFFLLDCLAFSAFSFSFWALAASFSACSRSFSAYFSASAAAAASASCCRSWVMIS